jgi:hypothetical protein
MNWKLLLAVLLIAAAALAASGDQPLATITSAEAIELRGIRVPVEGVPAWPLVAGDELATTTSAAAISFSDGTRVVLDKNSRVKIERVDKQPVLRLVSGSLSYQAGDKPRMEIFAGTEKLDWRSQREGSVSFVSGKARLAPGRGGDIPGKGKGRRFDPPGPPPNPPPRSPHK